MARKDEFGLTSKWRQFADLLLAHGVSNQAECYRTVYGCSQAAAEVNASKLMKPGHVVRAYVDERLKVATEAACEKLQYGKEDWLRDVLDGLHMASGKKAMATIVKTDKGPAEIDVKAVDLMGMARFTEQLGKALGVFTENLNLGGQKGNPVEWLLSRVTESQEEKGDSPLPGDHHG